MGWTRRCGRLRQVRWTLTVILSATALAATAPVPPLDSFIDAASPDDAIARPALDRIAAGWRDGYTSMLVDMARLMRPAQRPGLDSAEAAPSLDDDPAVTAPNRPPLDTSSIANPGSPIRRRLVTFLEKQTHQRFGDDLNRWREWMWALPYDPHPDYAVFKGFVYGQIDPAFRMFFPPGVEAAIRLDEIDWGGVRVNGIPPLRNPRVVPAAAATFLSDSNVVFGLVVNGEARAYPKRILAWHEMATDRVGGVDLTIVYCTLCGTVIPFDSRAAGRTFQFGTSGLLYRSNKLMFDEETHSLWSTFEGMPVVGPLTGTSVALTLRPIVTTTWKEWRLEHPETTVLSLDTGYRRDYSEGAAYRDYFSTDRLMFQVSRKDDRLRNKDEVLVMRLTDPTRPGELTPVAIDVRLLRRHPVFQFDAAHGHFIVVTSRDGANRVYRTDTTFLERRRGSGIIDASGQEWRATETALSIEGDASRDAPRVAAQRAFWFGWYAQFPRTVLLK